MENVFRGRPIFCRGTKIEEVTTMDSAVPFIHIYAGVLIVLLGFVLVEIRRLRKSMERK